MKKKIGNVSLTVMPGCDAHTTATCRSIDQNPSHSTQERCLLVVLVQTVYTTYGNDGIHFGVGTAMAAPAAAGSSGYPGGGGRRSGNSCTNSSGRSATAAAGAPVAEGGQGAYTAPAITFLFCSLL